MKWSLKCLCPFQYSIFKKILGCCVLKEILNTYINGHFTHCSRRTLASHCEGIG